jgi:ABC-2 type transport system permease protein
MSEPITVRKVRPFFWSLRRELWENPAIWMAPLAIEGVVLLAQAFATLHHPGEMTRAAAAGSAKAAQSLNMPYAAAAGAVFVISFVVSLFYCASALHGERRDRSILFWKSLPVSDTTTVLSKAAIPLVVQPMIVLAVAIVTQLLMAGWTTVVLLATGTDPSLYWRFLHLPLIWVMLPYGLVVNALWLAPLFAWFLLVSAWAKRMAFVWAVAPWLAAALFEFLAFRSRHVWNLIGSRIFDGYGLAYTVGGQGKAPISKLADVDPMVVVGSPGLWAGLAFAAAFLTACVWLRRRHDPI